MNISACHDGCLVEVGIRVPSCGFDLDPIEHLPWDCGEDGHVHEHWFEDQHCTLPRGHGGDHDPSGVPVRWVPAGEVPAQLGHVYQLRGRCRQVVGRAWSSMDPPTPVVQ